MNKLNYENPRYARSSPGVFDLIVVGLFCGLAIALCIFVVALLAALFLVWRS